MFFTEKSEEEPEKVPTVNTDNNNDVADISISDNKSLYGITDLSNDMNHIMKKVAMVYKSTLELKDTLSKKSNIAKGAVTQKDIQSIIKVMSHDIESYMHKTGITGHSIKKSYLQLENKIKIILVNSEMDETYTAVFNPSFFNKNLHLYMDKYLHEDIDSGVFLIRLTDMDDKSAIFIQNTYNAILKKIYPELRYLDIIARVSKDAFAVLVVNVSMEEFNFILKQIMKKAKLNNYKMLFSGGMISSFSSTGALLSKLESNLEQAQHTDNNFIFA